MTVYIIFPDAADGYLSSVSPNFATAQAGTGTLTADSTQTYLKVGMNISGNGDYYIHQSFISFDTSVIADAEEVVETSITAYVGWPQNQSVAWGQQFRQFNYTTPLTTAQWQTPALARTRPIIANFDHLFSAAPYQWRVTGRDTLTSISKTAATKFVVVSNTYADGYGTTGVQEVWMDGSRGVNKPYLTVWTTTLNTLNTITEASTTLSDGTTVSIRSNGVATVVGGSTPTLTVGYNNLTSSTWTSIGTLHVDFTKTTDGSNNVEIVGDPDGNFYIIGNKLNTTGTIIAQAYKKTGTNTWAAQTPLSASLPRGNEQTIRSISAVWNPAGKDSTDLPGIYGVAVRGSGGNRPEFPYHTSGAAYAHDWTLNPRNLLLGSGNLFMMSAVGYGNITEAGLPTSGDVIALGPNSFAAYTQRGKIVNTVVGGIQMMGMYQGFGLVKEVDKNYIATGDSHLVAVSSTVFAHVFDSEGTKLTVRFYNDRAQILGEASIQKDVFYGGVIGSQFAAYYDKAYNLVRVFYVDVSSARNLSRFDVSPVTFTGINTANVVTNVGSTGSVITDLRVSRTADERRVLIEAAVNTTGALSTSSIYTTVGNYAPSAPALVVRPNFDSTSSAIFNWKFGDQNDKDYQTAYQLEISRVSDSVVVLDTGKLTTPSNTYTLAANAIANGIAYRWRVRTYDVVDAVGTWSGYGTFTTAATGTLTITTPATDNVAGIETSSVSVGWTYVQSGGATQAQRRLRLIRTADSAVLLDTTMQLTGANGHVLTGLESGKEYRVEVTVINSSSVTTPVVSRLITPYYAEPMTPSMVINTRDSHVELVIVNPNPTGDRPQVITNDIYRRKSGSTAKDSDYIRIATVTNSATYKDYSVKSGTTYDYYVVGKTN